jgi:organic hydroperoxide reductase OsmC/OhrA
MHPYPHRYLTTARGSTSGTVTVTSPALPDLATAPPPEFGGPGGIWSPETLLCAAVADCFILTFRAVSRAARLEWQNLECEVQGTLERVDGVTRFSRFATRVVLHAAAGSDAEQARALLEKAEHSCLVANSLLGERTLVTEVVVSAG